jgi:hypothetical protein
MRSFIIISGLLLTLSLANAQTKLTRENIQKDSLIKADIIDPAVGDTPGGAPDWQALTSEITKKYDTVYADRTVTKAKIYFSYGKDWPAFTTAVVRYTDKYEPKDNLRLLNKNANFILQYSTDKKELEAAQGWSRHTVENDPANADYKKTYDALTAKINGN